MSICENEKVCYIFEDDEEDCLTKFLRKAFTVEEGKTIVFSGGNGNIKDKAEHYLSKGYRVYAFLDTIPGNSSITDKYYELLGIQKRDLRFMLIPIVCAEYYLLCSLKQWQFGGDPTILNTCVNKEVYFDVPEAIRTKPAADMPSFKTFEKFCKTVIGRYGNWCLRFKKGSDAPAYELMNKSVQKFYLYNCKCDVHRKTCTDCDLTTKLKNLISNYPVFPPCNIFFDSMHTLTRSELVILCDELVMEYNKLSSKLEQAANEDEKHFYEQLVLPSSFCLTRR